MKPTIQECIATLESLKLKNGTYSYIDESLSPHEEQCLHKTIYYLHMLIKCDDAMRDARGALRMLRGQVKGWQEISDRIGIILGEPAQ